MTFTTGDWDSAQTITVKAIDDGDTEGDHNSIIVHTAASSDTDYNQISISNVTANITDNNGASVLFTDSFENGQWDSKWTDDATNDWDIDGERSTDSSNSAHVDDADTNSILTSVAIDVSSYTSVTINFDWYIETNWDDDEYIKFETQTDANGWVEQDSLDGDVDEGSWVEYNDASFDVTGKSNLYLRFRAHCSGSNEDGFVDMVTVTAN